MLVEFKNTSYDTDKSFLNITSDVEDFIRDISAEDGVVSVFSGHTTACIKILEDELLSLVDIKQHLEMLAPEDGEYHHDRIDLRDVPPEERINAYSHIRSLYFNHSETIPVQAGMLVLGRWQDIFLVELDPQRKRTVSFSFVGTSLIK